MKTNNIMKVCALAAASVIAVALGPARLDAQGGKPTLPQDCIKYLSYYQEDYKNKDWKNASSNWRKAFAACPATASQNMYVHGTTLLTREYNESRDGDRKAALADSILMLQDRRMENFPAKRRQVLANKGGYIVNFKGRDQQYVYSELLPIVKELGKDSPDAVVVNLVSSASALYKGGSLKTDELIAAYSLSSDALSARTPKDDAERASTEKTDATIGSIFTASGAASCSDLVSIFTPRLEADPDNASLARTALSLLNASEDCQSNALYYKAAVVLHRSSPSAKTAFALYRLSTSGGAASTGVSPIEYLEEAVSLSAAGTEEHERYSLEAAQCAYREGQREKAYEYARSLAGGNGPSAGRALVILGNLWSSARTEGEVDGYARYWAAYDCYRRAKSLDPALGDEADRQMGACSKYFPAAADAFMYDLAEGQAYTVTSGGMSARTTVRVRK